MRVRIVRLPDPLSSGLKLTIQRWCAGQWEHVIDFPLHEAAQANDFALKLSMTNRIPIEVVQFEDGGKVEPPAPMSLEDRAKLLRALADSAAVTSYTHGLIADKTDDIPRNES